MTVLAFVVITLNYISNSLVSCTTIKRGGFMERLKQNVKSITASVVNGVSAVCSSVVATGLTAGLSSEGLRSLGFYLSSLTSSHCSPKSYKKIKKDT